MKNNDPTEILKETSEKMTNVGSFVSKLVRNVAASVGPFARVYETLHDMTKAIDVTLGAIRDVNRRALQNSQNIEQLGSFVTKLHEENQNMQKVQLMIIQKMKGESIDTTLPSGRQGDTGKPN